MKKITVLLVVFLSWVNVVNASLEITEIMYDPEGSDTNREWIKLYNDGDKDIKIIGGQTKASWRISGGESKESLHYINEDLNIGPNEYAVITKNKDIFNQEYSSFSGLVTTASISLNNTSGIVKIWDGASPRNVVAFSSYDVNDVIDDDEYIEEDEVSENSDIEEDKKEEKIIFKITTKIISPKIVTAGIAFSVGSLTTTNTGKTYNFGKFIWNFGDGMKIEVKESKLFDYIYEYPGEYILSLSYFDNSFVLVPDAIDRIIIKVIPSDIYISSIGTDMDPYVEIENKSKYEVNLSGWKINGVNKTFIFPEGTILLQAKKIKLSPKITGFTGSDIKYLVIENPSGAQVAIYPEGKKKITQNSLINNSSYNNSNSLKNNLKDNSLPENSQIINLNDLGANASGAKVNISNPIYYILGLVFIVALGFASFLFIKKKKDVPDYLEKTLRPEDMTIIE